MKNVFKTLPVVFGVAVVLYLVTLVKHVDTSAVVTIENVDVVGEFSFLDRDDVIAQVNEDIVAGYFAIDMNQVRERLLQHPWIKEASLRRTWPADLTVFIEEQKPIAFWNEDGYLSESGDVFRPGEIDRALALPQLAGPQNQHETVLRFMNRLYKEMAVLDYTVTRLSLDDRRAWQIAIIKEQQASASVDTTAAGIAADERRSIEVKLGRFDTERRLQRFIRILPALAAGSKTVSTNKEKSITGERIRVIDMRYPNGFAVQMAAQVKEA